MYVSAEQPADAGSDDPGAGGPRSAHGPSPRPSRRSFTAEYKRAIVTVTMGLIDAWGDLVAVDDPGRPSLDGTVEGETR